jgi:hypothetical protein
VKLLTLPKYGSLAAGTRYRFEQYFPALQREGWTISSNPLLDDGYLQRRFETGHASLVAAALGATKRWSALRKRDEHDAIWMAYEALPYAPAFVEKVLLGGGPSLVLDVDDAVFHIYDENRSRLVRALLGDKLKKLAEVAAAVFAGSPYLVDYFSAAGARVFHVPTVVDIERYLPATPPRRSHRIVVGWMGSPSTAAFLRAMQGPLARFQREIDAEVRLIGAHGVTLRGVRAEMIAWSEAREITDLQGFDIGIMPLDDIPFTRGKCGFKLVQCMATGIPVVASPVGVNTQLVEESGAGFLARTSDEWVEALLVLARSPELRAQQGAAGRRYVIERYSLQAFEPVVSRLLAEVTTSRK